MQSTTTLETAESSESLESNESEDRKSLQDSYSDQDHAIIEGKLRSTSTIIPVDEEYIISEEDVLMGENEDEDEGTPHYADFFS